MLFLSLHTTFYLTTLGVLGVNATQHPEVAEMFIGNQVDDPANVQRLKKYNLRHDNSWW